ncbi:MAG: CHASE2 domain-containing protein, partial [Parvibaculum sp.]|nr:CHASE2 domain-containing protein [Parvibaculum sp.]
MNPTPAFRRLSAILPGLVLVLSILVSIYDPQGTGTFLQNRVFDLYQRILPREAGPNGPRTVYVDIDAETAKRYGAWPWPRKRLDTLVEKVRDAGASAIVIDMALADPDPTATAELLRLWSPLPAGEEMNGLGRALTRLPNHERELAALLASTKSVVSFVPGKTSFDGRNAPARPAAIVPRGSDPRHYIDEYDTWRSTLPLFEAAASGNGAALPERAPGSTVRGLPMLVNLDGILYPSNVLEALRVAEGGTGYRAMVTMPENGFSFEIEPGIERVEIDGTGLAAQTLKDGRLRLYFGGKETRRSMSAGE